MVSNTNTALPNWHLQSLVALNPVELTVRIEKDFGILKNKYTIYAARKITWTTFLHYLAFLKDAKRALTVIKVVIDSPQLEGDLEQKADLLFQKNELNQTPLDLFVKDDFKKDNKGLKILTLLEIVKKGNAILSERKMTALSSCHTLLPPPSPPTLSPITSSLQSRTETPKECPPFNSPYKLPPPVTSPLPFLQIPELDYIPSPPPSPTIDVMELTSDEIPFVIMDRLRNFKSAIKDISYPIFPEETRVNSLAHKKIKIETKIMSCFNKPEDVVIQITQLIPLYFKKIKCQVLIEYHLKGVVKTPHDILHQFIYSVLFIFFMRSKTVDALRLPGGSTPTEFENFISDQTFSVIEALSQPDEPDLELSLPILFDTSDFFSKGLAAGTD